MLPSKIDIFVFCVIYRYTEDFEILHGDRLGLPDTMSFLKSLAELDDVYHSVKNTEKRQIRERMAAASLFNWEVSYSPSRTTHCTLGIHY